MTIEERVTELERRVGSLEGVTMPLIPLGPRPEDPRERDETIKRLADELLKTEAPWIEKSAAAEVPVDRSCRVLTDGSPVTPDHREINPATGQQKGYVVLCEEERAKGFVRPVRQSYTHKTCGDDTWMGLALAETYARDPEFYSGTFCATCRAHFPLDQFVWKGTNEQVGT